MVSPAMEIIDRQELQAFLRELSLSPACERSRGQFVRDVAMLQLKLLAGNVHNFILVPATLGAAFLDLFFKSGSHGSRFYRVLEWGRQADEAIGLYGALDTEPGLVNSDLKQEEPAKE